MTNFEEKNMVHGTFINNTQCFIKLIQCVREKNSVYLFSSCRGVALFFMFIKARKLHFCSALAKLNTKIGFINITHITCPPHPPQTQMGKKVPDCR